MAGRKSFKEELNLFERYSELSVPYFKFLKQMLESEDKNDMKWASERLEKAYVKMLPQDITSGGKELPAPIINVIQSNNSHEQDTGDEKADSGSTGGNVSE